MEFVLNEYHRNVSDEELLADIVRVANELQKKTISMNEYKTNGGKYHSTTIQKRFGGWVNALQRCSLLSGQKYRDVTKNDLAEDLQFVAEKLNKNSFSSCEYEYVGKYPRDLFFRRFGTWNGALEAADLKPIMPKGQGNNRKITEYQCFEEIERIWVELGRQPTTTDIKKGVSKFSLHAYERRFGSWRKALEFFVAYMNGEREVEQPTENEVDVQEKSIQPQAENKDKIVHKTKRDIPLRTRFLVMKRDDFKCCMCGRSPATTHGLEIQVDHIIPWAKGGESIMENLYTLCRDCNEGKGDQLET